MPDLYQGAWGHFRMHTEPMVRHEGNGVIAGYGQQPWHFNGTASPGSRAGIQAFGRWISSLGASRSEVFISPIWRWAPPPPPPGDSSRCGLSGAETITRGRGGLHSGLADRDDSCRRSRQLLPTLLLRARWIHV